MIATRSTWPVLAIGITLATTQVAAAADADVEGAKPSGNMQLRINQTLRYTLAQRVAGRDARIANNAGFDQGDALFGRNDLIANRLDWLGEFDLILAARHGLRLSAAAWVDGAYGERGRSNPAALGSTASPLSYTNNHYTAYTRRYYAGPSAEILDAFAFAALDWGETTWNLKFGRHAVVWGESLFGSAHAVAYGQTPSDGLKAVANPGASAKETALPIHQASLVVQVSPALSLLAQRLFEWRPNRLPEGGTYFGVSDAALMGPDVHRLAPHEGGASDWGLGVKWSPDWLDGTLGAYVRRFDDKAGWAAQPVGSDTRAVYARGIELWGLTLARNIGGIAMGAELSHRRNGPLTSITNASAPGSNEGARGDTWHGVINAVAALGPALGYDTATFSGELSWSRLDRVTHNAAFYRARGYTATCATGATLKGCADDGHVGLTLAFTPVWLQALPGIDLEMPLLYSTQLHGNAPSLGGGNASFTTWKIGLTARAYARHQFDLAYTGYDQKLLTDPTTPLGSRILGAPYKDKGWLAFTWQTAF